MSGPPLADLHEGTLNLLRAHVGQIAVFDADVPAKPPADSHGFVKPYIVVWPFVGNPIDVPLNGIALPPGYLHQTQLTCVGGDVTRCMQALSAARVALQGRRPYLTASPYDEQVTNEPIRVDPDIGPSRHYAPLIFTCTANQ